MKDFTNLLAPEARRTIRLNRQLKHAISQIVPAAALDAVALCRIEDELLHITLTSASWLSRLRFSEQNLLAEVKKLNLTASGIRWHVLPSRIDPPRLESIRQEALEIPPGAPIKITRAAEQFEDPVLRNSLQQVAKTMQTRIDEKQHRRNAKNRTE